MSKTDHYTTNREIWAAIRQREEHPTDNTGRERKTWWKSRSHHKWPAVMLKRDRRSERYKLKRTILDD